MEHIRQRLVQAHGEAANKAASPLDRCGLQHLPARVAHLSACGDPADSPARKQALEEAAWLYAATLEGVSAASLLPPVVSTTALTPLPTMTDARGTGEMSHANILAEITEALLVYESEFEGIEPSDYPIHMLQGKHQEVKVLQT